MTKAGVYKLICLSYDRNNNRKHFLFHRNLNMFGLLESEVLRIVKIFNKKTID